MQRLETAIARIELYELYQLTSSGGDFSEKHGPLEREGKHNRLGSSEHTADHGHQHSPYVCTEVTLVAVVFAAGIEENQPVQ